MINIDSWSYINIAEKVSQESTDHGDSGVRLRTAAYLHDHQVGFSSFPIDMLFHVFDIVLDFIG